MVSRSSTLVDPRTLAAGVVDPEIPVVTIEELGILRRVTSHAGRVVVTITPTYSGCPAMRRIEDDIVDTLATGGYHDVEVRTELSPPWTTDWISASGRRKLEEHGIAPPNEIGAGQMGAGGIGAGQIGIGTLVETRCPRCRSGETRTVSEFGSTACKALMVCSSCGEPFDRFKDH